MHEHLFWGQFQNYDIHSLVSKIEKKYPADIYNLDLVVSKVEANRNKCQSDIQLLEELSRGAVELVQPEAPHWEYIAALFANAAYKQRIKQTENTLAISSFYSKIKYLVKQKLYGQYLLDTYQPDEIKELEQYQKEQNDDLVTYSSFDLLHKRYMVHTPDGAPIESLQEMFMAISMHLAMKEEEKVYYAKRFYDMLSTWKVTMATPTMANARKPFHQLSSCFIDVVPDSLDGIYRSLDNFAKVSKFGGGMGMYFGKVRAQGSSIRGYKGAAGGVTRWIKLVNDTAVAVDQLGVRQGAVAVYLDAWHKDLPEFLQLRTNNGDDRMKAHDVFPAICYPDLFWKMAKDDLEGTWHLLCPHEVYSTKGYYLEDFYGQEWEEKYLDCIQDPTISKREIPIKDLIRLILKSAVETGTPFTFNRDTVNHMNPNNHQGIIYCSNLCTEIAQNMQSIELLKNEVITEQGDTVIVETTKPGDFVVCNLASLSLGNIDVMNDNEFQGIIKTVIRALDNVIDLNFYPLAYAKLTSHKYRAIGLGVSGYHHMLCNAGIAWESEEHLTFVDNIFEKINYYAVQASHDLAKQRGSYSCFMGSDWQTGAYFTKRKYTSERWQKLQQDIHQGGIRNGYIMAIAPTSSTSILAGTTAGLDPILKRFFLEEKKGGALPRVAPNLSLHTYWLYKNAHHIDQRYSIQAAGIRQRHIDQAQSVNLYITNSYTLKQILNLYILAWESQVKTIYYIRSQALEVEECESCSA